MTPEQLKKGNEIQASIEIAMEAKKRWEDIKKSGHKLFIKTEYGATRDTVDLLGDNGEIIDDFWYQYCDKHIMKFTNEIEALQKELEKI